MQLAAISNALNIVITAFHLQKHYG